MTKMHFVFGKHLWIPIPQKLVEKSHYLSCLKRLGKESEIDVSHVCTLHECFKIVQAITEDKTVAPYFFNPCTRLCHVLSVDKELLKQLIPLHEVSCRNMPYLIPMLFTLWRSTYKEIVQDLCLQHLGKRLTHEQTKTYEEFRKTIRTLCECKIRNSRELYNRLKTVNK